MRNASSNPAEQNAYQKRIDELALQWVGVQQPTVVTKSRTKIDKEIQRLYAQIEQTDDPKQKAAYQEKLKEAMYEWAAAFDRSPERQQHVRDTLEQIIYGNWTNKTTGLGTAAQIGLGFTDLDLPMDIRDIAYDVAHLDSIPWWQLPLDSVSLLPIVGALKYTDEVADGVKAAARAADAADDIIGAAEAGKNAVEPALDIIDGIKYNDIVKAASNYVDTYSLTPTQGQTLSRKAFANLMNDIKENGIKESIKCVRLGDDLYVVDGHHRLLAAKRLGIERVPIEEVQLPYKGYKTINDLFWW